MQEHERTQCLSCSLVTGNVLIVLSVSLPFSLCPAVLILSLPSLYLSHFFALPLSLCHLFYVHIFLLFPPSASPLFQPPSSPTTSFPLSLSPHFHLSSCQVVRSFTISMSHSLYISLPSSVFISLYLALSLTPTLHPFLTPSLLTPSQLLPHIQIICHLSINTSFHLHHI